MKIPRLVLLLTMAAATACADPAAAGDTDVPIWEGSGTGAEEDVVDDPANPDDTPVPDLDTAHSTNVLCTGQTTCAVVFSFAECPTEGEAFFGQDKQYSAQGMCTKREYAVTEETVTDIYTGLVWQRNLPPTYDGCSGGISAGSLCSWQEASDHCRGLSLDGRDDWRLPTAGELEILINYGRYDPSIDATAFPDTPPDPFWTASADLGDAEAAWHVDFHHGYVYRSDKKNSYHVRCVSGAEAEREPEFIEIAIDQGVLVLDTSTGLMWTKGYWDTTWEEALKYCEAIIYAGQRDWRLPNINELKTLIERETTAPASLFPGMPRNSFWSSTTYSSAPYLSMHVDMTTGDVYGEFKGNVHFMRCVR